MWPVQQKQLDTKERREHSDVSVEALIHDLRDARDAAWDVRREANMEIKLLYIVDQ